VDLGFFSIISGDEVIHCSHVAPWTDPDCFAGRDLNGRNRLRFWTDVVGINLPWGVYHIRVTVQSEDLFKGPPD
jgi:hypothetical protein